MKSSSAWMVGFVIGWITVSLGWETGQHNLAMLLGTVICFGGGTLLMRGRSG